MLLTILSCEKEEVEELKPIDSSKIDYQLLGLYEWSFLVKTIDDQNVYVESSESENKFAIKIYEDARLITFRDGEEIETYYITSINSSNNKQITCYTENKTKKLVLYRYQDMLKTFNFPVIDAESYFYKN